MMTKLLRIIKVLILTVFTSGIGIISIHYLYGKVFPPLTDYPILNPGSGFQMLDVMGQLRKSDEWHGQVILINFWATWCPPCRKEIPSFMDLYHTYQDQGLVVIGIAIDELENVRHFLMDFNVDYPNLIGDAQGIALATRYGNRKGGLPYTVIIDRAGKVASTHLGELPMAKAEQIIRSLL